MLFSNGFLESRLAKFVLVPVRTATKRASGGKAANNNTAGRRLGAKKSENEYVEPGMIIWRQRGTQWYPGENAGIGRDHTIFAKEPGFVRYYRDPFHAKRRFIGIALDTQDRLPTPHFHPRKRRFGYTPIENEEVAEFELNFFGRKETHRLNAREQILSQRAEAQQQRIAKYGEVLKNAGVSGELAGNQEQLQRLDQIYQYICGSGLTFAEADEIVSQQVLDDLQLDVRVGRLAEEEREKLVSAFNAAKAEINQKVTFGLNTRELVSTAQFNDTTLAKVEPKLKELAEKYLQDPKGTPQEVVAEFTQVLQSSPGLSTKEIQHLKRKYLRRPQSIAVDSSNKKELQKRVKSGEGKFVPVFDQKLKQVFVPEGSKVYL